MATHRGRSGVGQRVSARNVMGLLVVGALALVQLVGMQPASAEGTETIGNITIVRSRTGFDLAACLQGVQRPTWPETTIPSTIEVRANGHLVEADNAGVRAEIPAPPSEGIDAPEPCSGNVFAHLAVSINNLESAGISLPPDGEWVDFQLRLQVEVQGRTFAGERQIELGAGPTTGQFTSLTATSGGARIQGWAVNPNSDQPTRLWVTVDGRDWYPNLRTWSSPDDTEQPAKIYTNTRDLDPKWERRGISDLRKFDLYVPFGRVCVDTVDFPEPEDEVIFRRLGCLDSPIRGTPSASISATVGPTAGYSTNANAKVTVKGVGFNPWLDKYPPNARIVIAEKGRILDVGSGPVRPRPDIRSVLADGTGSFDFVATVPSLDYGKHILCAYMSEEIGPSLWWNWIYKDWLADPQYSPLGRNLGCLTVTVPLGATLPIGTLDRVTAGPGRITVSGWALDPNGGSPNVLIWLDGKMAALTKAMLPRPDVTRVHGGDGRSGFEASIGASKGKHQVCTAWQDTGSLGWSSPTCASVVVK